MGDLQELLARKWQVIFQHDTGWMLGPTVGTFGTVLEHRVFQEHAAAYCLAVGTAFFLLVRRATNPMEKKGCQCSRNTPGFTAGGSLGTLFSGIKYWHLIKIGWKHVSKSPKSSTWSSGYQTISLVLAQLIYVWFSLSELKSSHRMLFLSQPF